MPKAPPEPKSAAAALALRSELMRVAPFAQMDAAHVDRFIANARPARHAAGDTVLSPQLGVVQQLHFIRHGSVSGRRGMAEAAGGFEFEAGDLFPVGAVVGARPVTATYTANEDTLCLLLPAADARQLAADSAPFADFLNRRVIQLLELSQRALQVAYSSQTLAEQSLDTPLSALARRPAVVLRGDAPLAQALALIHERHIGSVVVVDADGAAQGILTRHDVIGRVALAQLPLATPVAQVMTAPVQTLSVADTAHDAVLLMSRHGIRHLPVTDDARVVAVVSERDLFAMQRLSLKQVSRAIRGAHDVAALRMVAQDIRRFARNLLGQGVGARQLTELTSRLNDALTERVVQLMAQRHGRDLNQACWLAFGSEGRGEQTLATDQDNGLVFASDAAERDRPAWLAFARDVNDALDACGYPLCRGNVMASNPACCLTAGEWCARFTEWMEHGAPDDLLNASIYFDFRPLIGRAELAEPLRALVGTHGPRLPRFMKQMADNALRNRVPLNWRGGIDAKTVAGRSVLDLKMQGTAIYVDAARLYALAHGIAETNTRARFEAVARVLQVDAQERDAWIRGFEFLQLLRLQVQLQADAAGAHPNLVDIDTLNDIDRRVLKEALRVARRLQQRMELDYQRS